MRIKIVKAIVAVLLFGMGNLAAAEQCIDRTGWALAELMRLMPEMGEAQTADAKRILEEMCSAPDREDLPAAATTMTEESGTPTVLGVEFNKAEPDSKGHSRLKKAH